MKLILVRHAAAIERSEDVTEERRYLTAEGRAFFRKTARTMLKNGVEPSLILSSPLVRAVQTADILAEALSYIGPVVATEALAPGFTPQGLQRLLTALGALDELVIVGHEPDLSGIASALLESERSFRFRKGTALSLKSAAFFQAPARFRWLASGKKLVTSRDEAFAQRDEGE